jgi:bis(5'-nucleosyl)-tetraphosphatase (symmetrical)
MPTYAIGDVQGCLGALERLLAKIKFDASRDTLWFTGDLINRGPESLATLRFIRSLGNKHRTVLGNHDLHLLAIALGGIKLREGDTFKEILCAPDCEELIDWLRHQPLLFHDKASHYVLVHAGLAPAWTLEQAIMLAQEVEEILQGDHVDKFFQQMYGNHPDCWRDDLTGIDRQRCIVNCFTRMRLCYPDGRLNLDYKGAMHDKPTELIPWFDVADRKNKEVKIIFGHWAALGGIADVPNVYPLDTGCVWGNCLTAMRIEDSAQINVSCA